jgi:hypothetical protein
MNRWSVQVLIRAVQGHSMKAFRVEGRAHFLCLFFGGPSWSIHPTMAIQILQHPMGPMGINFLLFNGLTPPTFFAAILKLPQTVDDNSLLKRLNADDPNLPKVPVEWG